MPILDTLADCHRAVMTDDSFGERVILLPRAANGRRDPDRERVEISAVYRSSAEQDANASGGRRQDWSLRTEAGEAQLYIDLAKYPGLTIRGGDEIQLLDRPGAPYAEVANVDRRSSPRMIVGLRETAQ